MIKWAIYGVIMGVTIHLVKNYETRIQEQNFEAGRLLNDDSFKSNLDLYLILFLLQHPIFMVARIPIFFLYTLLTCCCDKGVDHNESEQFKNAVIHFDFIPFELGQLNNFENHLVGRNELQYMRRLSLVRSVSIRERQAAADAQAPNQSILQRQATRLTKTIHEAFSGEALNDLFCTICAETMKSGDKVIQLACYETHQLHENCYANFIETNNRNN